MKDTNVNNNFEIEIANLKSEENKDSNSSLFDKTEKTVEDTSNLILSDGSKDDVSKVIDSNGNERTFKYCPYCGKALIKNNDCMFCEECDEEFGYVSSSSEIDDDYFEQVYLERKGKKHGLYLCIVSSIATFMSMFFIILSMIYTDTNGNQHLNYTGIIGATLLGMNGVVIDIISFVIALKQNKTAARLGYKRIGTTTAAMWISIIGFSFGLLFYVTLLVKTLSI